MAKMLVGIFTWLASFISGPALGALTDAYKAKLQSGNNEDKLATDLATQKVQLETTRLQVQGQVLVAEQGAWLTRMVRPLFALPFIIFLWKVIVWDKVLGIGTTDNLSPELWDVAKYILGAYFIGKSAEVVATRIKG